MTIATAILVTLFLLGFAVFQAGETIAVIVAPILNLFSKKLDLQKEHEADSVLAGRIATVVQCDSSGIKVDCDGTIWSAIVEGDGSALLPGQQVRVLGSRGISLRVRTGV